MELPVFDPPPDIRLIAADMDGTLLDDDKELHDHFWPLVDALFERGIVFSPASGRQYHTLYRCFGDVADELVYIAENGAYLVRGTEEVGSDVVDDDVVARLVLAVRGLTDAGADLGVVVCGKRSAYVERTDPGFRAETDEHYAVLAVLDDLLDRPSDEILKVAVYDFGDAEQTTWPALSAFTDEAQVVLSGEHWVDVQNLGTNKGTALRRVQQALGVTSAQTMVFGDFLNDLEMMDAAEYFLRHGQRPPTAAGTGPVPGPTQHRERCRARDLSGTRIPLDRATGLSGGRAPQDRRCPASARWRG